MVRSRVRVRFCKVGKLRLLGHRDLARTLERLLRRAGVRLAMSQGFHPKPKMGFPAALGLGIEGLDEVMHLESESDGPLDTDELLARLRAEEVDGLRFVSVQPVSAGDRGRLGPATYEVAVPSSRRDEVAAAVARFVDSSSFPYCRKGKSKTVELTEAVESIELVEVTEPVESAGTILRIRLAGDGGPSANCRDVLTALELLDLESSGGIVRRTRVEVTP